MILNSGEDMGEWIKQWNVFRKCNEELLQILFSLVIIGFFSIAENWLLFYMGSWTMSIIFSVLKIMMWCVLAINIYMCVKGTYKKTQKTETLDDNQLQEIYDRQFKKMEEVRMIQLRSAKAMLDRQEELAKMVRDLEIRQEMKD